MCASVTADRGFTWSDEETALLLQLWGANDAQSELTGNTRNFPVYEKISECMSSMGYMRTASQCREKIKRMKREYSLTMQHYDKLLDPQTTTQLDEKRSGPKKNMRFFEQFHKILLEKQNRTQRNASLKASSGDASQNKKKRPSFEVPFIKSTMEILTLKLLKYQAESDARILSKMEELENQRTAMDERMQKMWLDFEEKRRLEEREHELKVMKIFQDIVNQMNVNHVAKE